MVRGIIFDCFGVLYVDAGHAYLSFFPQHKDQFASLNYAANYGLISRDDYINSLSELTGQPPSQVVAALLDEHILNQTLIDYIYTLKPQYKIGLLSNIGSGWIKEFFDQHNLHDLFDVVVLSGEEKIAKPDPVIFQRTAQRLGFDTTECIMIDDAAPNCTAARAVGMHAVQYDSVDQTKQDVTAILGA